MDLSTSIRGMILSPVDVMSSFCLTAEYHVDSSVRCSACVLGPRFPFLRFPQLSSQHPTRAHTTGYGDGGRRAAAIAFSRTTLHLHSTTIFLSMEQWVLIHTYDINYARMKTLPTLNVGSQSVILKNSLKPSWRQHDLAKKYF